jgi:hypothetical protein
MSSKHDRPGLPRIGHFLLLNPERGGALVPRGKLAKAKCARFAEEWEVDESTVLDWANGREEIPEELIEPMAEWFGVSVCYFMRWEDAPRSMIPDHWRRLMAEDAIDRTTWIITEECNSLLETVEWRLTAEAEFEDPAPGVPRLQRLRRVLMEIQNEPIDPERTAAHAEAQTERKRVADEIHRRFQEHCARWEAISRVEREAFVLNQLADAARLTIEEVAARGEDELGIPAAYMATRFGRIMRQMHKAGRLDRAVVVRNVHCYFHPLPLDGAIAELECSYQSDAGAVA